MIGPQVTYNLMSLEIDSKSLNSTSIMVYIVHLIIALTLSFRLSQGQGLDVVFSNTSGVGDSEGSCPTWHIWSNETNGCVCHDLHEVVKCHPAAALLYGYCMTHDNYSGETHVGKCVYTTFSRMNESLYTKLPQSPVDLDEAVCGQWNRKGYLCSECKDGFGLSIANLYMNCVECSLSEGVGWLLFLVLQLVPVSIMFAVVMVFRLSITQPPMSAFVFFSQLSLVILYVNYSRFQTPFQSSSASNVFSYLVRSIYLPLLSLWNLSFSSIAKITNFCVHPGLDQQQAHLLTYITNIHVILLVAVAYLFIELHARNCRIVVWLWKPFRKCFIRSSRVWNPRLTTVDTFATFLMVSYNRFIVLSYFIYAFQHAYTLSEPLVGSVVLQFNPTVGYFSLHHFPYMLISLFILLIFVLAPAIILAFYQMKCFMSCLCLCGIGKLQPLHMFVAHFQGHYKDGTGGTRDLRFMASLYLYLRLAILLGVTLCDYSSFVGCREITSLVLLLITLALVIVAQPYKKKIMNKIDALLLIMLVLIMALLTAISKSIDTTVNAVVLSFVLLLIAIPQVIFFSFVVYKLSIGVSKLHCSQKVLQRYQAYFHKEREGSQDELTLSQIDSSIFVELSTARFDSSYQDDSCQVFDK